MPKVTGEERIRRDAAVVADRLRGFGWAAIAQRHKLSERAAREIFRRHLRAQPFDPQEDPREALAELLGQIDAQLEDIAQLVESTHDAVRLGALRARGETLNRRHELLIALGLVPTAEECVHRLAVEDIAKATHEVLRSFVPEKQRAAAKEALAAALEPV